jgi:hypothetical protein
MFRPLLLCDKIVLEAKEQVCRKEKVRTQKHESGRRKESDHTLPLRVPAEKNLSAFVAGWIPHAWIEMKMEPKRPEPNRIIFYI